jgi:RNA-directed DNA polymerase
MRGRSMHENRETSATPGKGVVQTGRSGKAGGQKPDMHVGEESDTGIVPMEGLNKTVQTEAEALEGRPVTKGNSGEKRL